MNSRVSVVICDSVKYLGVVLSDRTDSQSNKKLKAVKGSFYAYMGMLCNKRQRQGFKRRLFSQYHCTEGTVFSKQEKLIVFRRSTGAFSEGCYSWR